MKSIFKSRSINDFEIENYFFQPGTDRFATPVTLAKRSRVDSGRRTLKTPVCSLRLWYCSMTRCSVGKRTVPIQNGPHLLCAFSGFCRYDFFMNLMKSTMTFLLVLRSPLGKGFPKDFLKLVAACLVSETWEFLKDFKGTFDNKSAMVLLKKTLLPKKM